MDAPAQLPIAAPRAEPRAVLRRKKRRFGARTIGFALALAALALGGAMKLRPVPVTATPVQRGTAVDAVYATGSVEAKDRVIVKARAGGTVDLKVREGARVKKGDLVAVVDSPFLKSELARGKAEAWAAAQHATANGPQLAAALAQGRAIDADLAMAKDDRDRVKRLAATGSVPQAELDRANARVSALEAQRDANVAQRGALRIDLAARATGSAAEVDSLSARLADTEVRAPMDGVVLSRSVEPGEVVMIDQPLVKIGDVEDLVLECAIDESDVGKVAIGQKAAVSIYAFPNAVFRGEVFEILPDADRTKKSFLTKIRLEDAPKGLRSGMTVEVNIVAEERENALLAPAAGIDPTGTALVVRDGRLVHATPKLGVRDLLSVEIKDGLAEGDLVVVGGADGLADGVRVRPTVAPPPAAVRTSGARSGMSL